MSSAGAETPSRGVKRPAMVIRGLEVGDICKDGGGGMNGWPLESCRENYLDLRWEPSFGLSQLMSFLTGVPSSSMLASATRHDGTYLVLDINTLQQPLLPYHSGSLRVRILKENSKNSDLVFSL